MNKIIVLGDKLKNGIEHSIDRFFVLKYMILRTMWQTEQGLNADIHDYYFKIPNVVLDCYIVINILALLKCFFFYQKS